ncbi:MAG: exodeoxyribonuclease VII large subunit [Prevotella sp.]|nr:exodeoxyribonuclease VII large subunit [Prevotella sp.]
MRNDTLTLYELNSLVRETIEIQLPQSYWVEAEVSEVREVRGHCYMQLIEKDAHSNTPIAQASARCWKNTWMLVRPHFERVTGQKFHAGLKVLLQVYAQFHENYGFSWIVTDIDPTFTMGDMARKRQEIIRQLKEEGVFDLNKELALPLFAQRIAVVSSAGAAGYGDFVNQLEHNEFGFCFQATLFPATMQGEGVEQSVIDALNQINAHIERFDCVVIIRGGGAVADLSGFDTLLLAENVANFPLPVITGIGHERDESVLDMISHTRVKTPTAAAAFLIGHLKQTADRIQQAQDYIINKVNQRMQTEQLRLANLARVIPSLFSVVKTKQEARLEMLFNRCLSHVQNSVRQQNERCDMMAVRTQMAVEKRLMKERHRLQLLMQRTDAVNPELLLRRGYSITLHNGKAVRDASQLRSGDHIETRLEKGVVRSVVEETRTSLEKPEASE